jgi:parvulin-like peptidyl-prolyl isomerase
MSDELPKKVFSVPPPPTDEIDSEWGGKAADEKPAETATEAADRAVVPAKDSGPPGADAKLKAELKGQAETAAAPGTPPPPAPREEEDEDEDDEDEDDEDDEDEDDEEDEAPAARARASHSPVSRTAAPGADGDWIPDWAPFAVLALLVVLGVAGGLGAFTKPPAEGATAAPSTALAAETSRPTSIAASHFLVMYKGSMRAPETVTRTKDEARARALEGLAKVKKGEDFAKIVGEYTDEPGGGAKGGALGEFTAERMVKPFSDAAFALKVGQISGLVETPFGFHVIKRTK